MRRRTLLRLVAVFLLVVVECASLIGERLPTYLPTYLPLAFQFVACG